MPYLMPDPDIVRVIDAPPTPAAVPSPDGSMLALVESDANPPVALLARQFLRLGGVRVDPARGGAQRVSRIRSITVQPSDGGPARAVQTPDDDIGGPLWAPDSSRIAFLAGTDVWVADVSTGASRALGIRVNDVIGAPFSWSRDGTRLLVRLVPAARGAAPEFPREPRVEETTGKQSQMATFQDLLTNPNDEALFEHFATTQLAWVDVATGAVTTVGAPGLISSARHSPDGRWLLVTIVRRPFSYRVPFSYFTRTVEVWTAEGTRARVVADLPVTDEIPRQGVPTGPRAITWRGGRDATLLWTEALDGGDPMTKADHRDRLLTLDAPFDAEPREVLRTQHRLQGIQSTDLAEVSLLTETDRDRRWRTTWIVDLDAPDARRVLFDLSARDAYGDPGQPVTHMTPDGERTILVEDGRIWLNGRGASPRGSRPFLDGLTLATGETERVWECGDEGFESFVAFTSSGGRLTRRESAAMPPNYYADGKPITSFQDPHPEITGVRKELIRYKRDDGVELSGTLYLPPGYDGGRVPVLLWAYPMEYSDADTAGQVRGSDKGFTRIGGASALVFLLRGWSVLMDATMPIVGDPETMNDTFVDQVTASARAAIDALDERGVVDRSRVVASGHSYGGFMTATLLAHTDLFAAGIARSGAYNRSLTPFGFQSERRSYWEVPDVYRRVSPFSYADRITVPILLIHGEEDNNSGTFTIQSVRLYQALQGLGATARLVLLPHEAHGYRGRESILHTIAESLAWVERWVPAATAKGDRTLQPVSGS